MPSCSHVTSDEQRSDRGRKPLRLHRFDRRHFAAEIYPGYPGLVVEGDSVRAKTCGFLLVLKSKKTGAPLTPKPVNNTREDKLGRVLAPQRR